MQYLWKAKTQVQCLVCLVVMSAVAGVPARGDVVIFDNRGGEFEWRSTCDPSICTPDRGTYLDVTQPSSQSGESSDVTFPLWYYIAGATPHWEIHGLGAFMGPPGEVRIAADDEPTALPSDAGGEEDFYFARELGPGDIVDGGLNMRSFAYLWVYNPGGPSPEVMEVIDRPSYIGVSFVMNSQRHYGWILIDSPDNFYLAGNFEALMWAYETVPDTPITIPGSCPADFNGNGGVDIDDFLALLAAWGPCPGCPQDLDGDDNVGIADFLTLLANWGPCPVK